MSEHQHRAFVSVEDGVKPAEDYAPARKVRVELTSDVFNQQELGAAVDYLGQLASQQVARLLGRAVSDVEQPAANAPAATRTRRTKEQIAADKAAAEAPAASDPTALEDPTELPQSSGDHGSTTTAETDPAALDDDFTVQPEPPAVETSGQIAPISDGDLNAAVQKRNGELASADGTKAIRALIATFNPDKTKVFQLREITADRRAEFLNGLNAITA